MTKDYYLGFDLGTNSVGWAVTDMEYRLEKFKGNLMWGVNLFDSANTAKERRKYRTARRRFDRKQQRIKLLQELFTVEIAKIDPKFFTRLKESALYPEEKGNINTFFDDEEYTDKEYYREYPTIHHLICELIHNKSAHDVRLVYLACAYLLAHRGHFLLDVDEDNIDKVLDFADHYNNFLNWFDSMGYDYPFECNLDDFKEVLKKKLNKTEKEKEFNNLLFGGKSPKDNEDYPIKISALIKLISGGTPKLYDLFKNENYKSLEKNSICVADAAFDDNFFALSAELNDGDGDLLLAVKQMYDWSLLSGIFQDDDKEKLISNIKVQIYDIHKNDLINLKYIIKHYMPKKYNEIFREASKLDNYVSYSYNVNSVKNIPGESTAFKKCNSQEDFCKFIKSYLEKIKVDEKDKNVYDTLVTKATDNTLCPKQVSSDNRIIPYQLYYHELKLILENAESYLPFLKEKDEYGSISDKILSIMKFRIPYYVGPLVSFKGKNCHAWIERKADGKIYPWNFEEKVDLDKSEEAFIRRMTCKCTYIAGEDVLPKNSLLYTKYTVLNEINSLSVDGKRISVQNKQDIYNHFFIEQRAKVTKKKIRDFLISKGSMGAEQTLSGVDDVLKSSLKPYHDFKSLLTSNTLTEADAEAIIERITATADRKRLKKWLKENYKNLSDEDISYISRLKYADYGRLSKTLLNGICDVDNETGEILNRTVISMMWETQQNLMELLSNSYGFATVIENLNNEYYGKNPKTLTEKLEEWYVPTAARRTIIRTLDIAKEIKHIMQGEPKKIFIEMARGGGIKGKTTKSRKASIKEFLETAREFTDNLEIDHLEKQLEEFNDSNLRSEKYYLYFMQLGRCMYSGEAINLDQIGNDSIYNIDHIIPQAKKTDDSLNNKVLVKSELNGAKKDDYPISEDIRHRMFGFWKSLKEKELITEEKFKRLTRPTPFTQEELSEFINRQIVETSQSAKAAALLLKEMFPSSDIVYVKAGLVSEFRHEYDMVKCREVNDLHHAQDAYLNIVMGNIHDVLFTKNPVNLIKDGDRYSMKMKTYLSWNIKRGDIEAWNPDKSFEIVKKMMSKNSVRYVRYSYKVKGKFYQETVYKAAPDLIKKKKELAAEKYGGYNSSSINFFVAVKFGEPSVCIMPVELLYADKFESNKDFAVKYTAETLSKILSKDVKEEDVSFPLGNRIIKKDALIEIDGCRYNISSKFSKGRALGITLAESLALRKDIYNYIKKIMSFIEKSERCTKFKVSKFDGISKERNIEIFDVLSQKYVNKPFNFSLEKIGKKITAQREEFEKLSIEKQILLIDQLVLLLKTGRSAGCDLQAIGESKKAGVITMNSTLNKIKGLKTVYIIDQSPTGLLEKRSPNLLEL